MWAAKNSRTFFVCLFVCLCTKYVDLWTQVCKYSKSRKLVDTVSKQTHLQKLPADQRNIVFYVLEGCDCSTCQQCFPKTPNTCVFSKKLQSKFFSQNYSEERDEWAERSHPIKTLENLGKTQKVTRQDLDIILRLYLLYL